MDTPSVKSRLIEFLEYKDITRSELARLLDVSPAYVGAMRKSLPEDKVLKLCAAFPDLNRDWLLYGEGDMLLEGSGDRRVSSLRDYEVPLLPVEAYAGSLQMWSEGIMPSQCDMVVAPMPGVDLAIRIAGNSMEPEFHNGSMIFLKKINERAFIPWGNPLVIDTENGVLVKAVYPGNTPGSIEARSYNPDYPPFSIPVDSIYGLYRILADVRQFNTM